VVAVEEQRGDVEGVVLAAAHRDQLVVAQQLADAGDLDAEALGHVGEGEPRADEGVGGCVEGVRVVGGV